MVISTEPRRRPYRLVIWRARCGSAGGGPAARSRELRLRSNRQAMRMATARPSLIDRLATGGLPRVAARSRLMHKLAALVTLCVVPSGIRKHQIAKRSCVRQTGGFCTSCNHWRISPGSRFLRGPHNTATSHRSSGQNGRFARGGVDRPLAVCQ